MVDKDQLVTGWRIVGQPKKRSDGHMVYTVDSGGKRKRDVLVCKGTRMENISNVITQALFPQYG